MIHKKIILSIKDFKEFKLLLKSILERINVTILSGPRDPVPIFYPLKPMPKIILNLDSDQENENKISSQMIPSTINLCGLSFYCSDGFNAANLQNFSCHSTSEEKDL